MPEVLISGLVTAGEVDVEPTQPSHKAAHMHSLKAFYAYALTQPD